RGGADVLGARRAGPGGGLPPAALRSGAVRGDVGDGRALVEGSPAVGLRGDAARGRSGAGGLRGVAGEAGPVEGGPGRLRPRRAGGARERGLVRLLRRPSAGGGPVGPGGDGARPPPRAQV